jgi:hypothetical protein
MPTQHIDQTKMMPLHHCSGASARGMFMAGKRMEGEEERRKKEHGKT